MSQQGFRPYGSLAGDLTQATFPFVVSNGIKITAGNAVNLVGGYLENCALNDTVGVLGVAAETVTGNTTAGTTCGVFTDPNLVYYNTTQTLLELAQSSVGKCFKIATQSGKQYISLTAGAVNSGYAFICLKINPDGDGDQTKGLWKIYKGQLFNATTDGLQ